MKYAPVVGRKGRGRRWRREGARPRIWAHRGASAHVTENTLAAFAEAARVGADGIEVDAIACRTGELVVFHDDDLARMTGRRARISELPLAEVRAIELPGGHRIPLLAEVFEACPALEINVELKSPAPGRAGTLPAIAAKLIRDARAGDRVLVSSFDPWALVQVHRAAPELSTALLLEANQPLPAGRGWMAPWVGASAIHPEDVQCSAAAVAGWRKAGYAVAVWTVDDPARLRELAAWGVDGVFANDPAAAAQALITAR